ncbi:hypothetical protein OPV22_027894 [Ensete ventricosum]|uniref:Uncharacterized protein n=1 Tax=Ensete ventricosum TaxID=4639 RepID=A0AAV8P5V1_ENSVE|nr:hypothetical protein OPV22_027894 [Ensete ventricosum]
MPSLLGLKGAPLSTTLVPRKCSPTLCSGYLRATSNHRFFYKLTILFQAEYLIGVMQPFLCFLAADAPFVKLSPSFYDLKFLQL